MTMIKFCELSADCYDVMARTCDDMALRTRNPQVAAECRATAAQCRAAEVRLRQRARELEDRAAPVCRFGPGGDYVQDWPGDANG